MLCQQQREEKKKGVCMGTDESNCNVKIGIFIFLFPRLRILFDDVTKELLPGPQKRMREVWRLHGL